MEHEILTLPEVAKYWQVHPSTIYHLLKQRKLPAMKIGRVWRFRKLDIDNWITTHMRDTDGAKE